MHHRFDGLLHIAMSRELLAGPIPKRAALRRTAADIVQRDRPDQRVVFATHKKQGQGRAVANTALRPIHAVGKGFARQVVMRPGRFPNP